ncbi:T9SS type A sorting domain-containing protein [Hymenobacter koreensis]|uniref:T9SS type A sorting domain-containing protein n=1 Tax=Hymenobacter koreensis TaxID=1084523 RepID=A0ABP8IXN0_9BACT
MRFIFLLLLFCGLLAAGSAGAQVRWQRTFGRATSNEAASELLPLRAGGYLIVGRQEFPARVYLVRTNSQGDTLWTRRFAIRGFEVLYTGRACEDPSGRVLITGDGVMINNNSSNGDAFLMLVDTNARGDSLWTRRTTGPTHDMYYDVTLDSNNNFFLSAGLMTQSQLLRIAASGQVLQQILPPPNTAVSCIVKVPGGFWVTSPNFFTPANARFRFVSDAGVFGATKPYLPGNLICYFLTAAEPGYVLMGGDGRLIKLTTDMDTVWSRQLRYFQRLPSVRHVRVTPDNNYVALAENYTPGGMSLSLHKLTRHGQQLRDTLFYRGDNTYAAGLAVGAAGDYVFAASLQTGTIGRGDIGLASLRPWSTVLATGPAASITHTLEAWPNPTSEFVTLRLPRPLVGKIELHNTLGQLMRAWPAAPSVSSTGQQVSLAGLASGLYLLTATDAAGNRSTVRLLKQ